MPESLTGFRSLLWLPRLSIPDPHGLLPSFQQLRTLESLGGFTRSIVRVQIVEKLLLEHLQDSWSQHSESDELEGKVFRFEVQLFQILRALLSLLSQPVLRLEEVSGHLRFAVLPRSVDVEPFGRAGLPAFGRG